MGYFDGQRFVLSIGLSYGPSDEEVDFFKVLFGKVSEALFLATGGKHSIGYVFFARSNSTDHADIHVEFDGDDRYATDARLYLPGTSIEYGQNYLPQVTTLLHELCHYLYDLGDEYEGPNGLSGLECPPVPNPDDTRDACVMNHFHDSGWYDGGGSTSSLWSDWTPFWNFYSAAIAAGGTPPYTQGRIKHFCHSAVTSHVTNPESWQQRRHSKSCWATLADDPRNLNLQLDTLALAPGAPGAAVPAGPPAAVQVHELVPTSRFVLVLDRSGSMRGQNFSELKIGANFWVDFVATTGNDDGTFNTEELEIIAFDDLATVVEPITGAPLSVSDAVGDATGAALTAALVAAEAVSDAWRDPIHTKIDGLVAGGNTALGDALSLAVARIKASGMPANPSIVLFSDGLQTLGTETIDSVLAGLSVPGGPLPLGLRFHVVGLGDDQLSTELQKLTTQTGGIYAFIPDSLP